MSLRALLLLPLLLAAPLARGEERVAVFVPSLHSAAEMEKALTADKSLSTVRPVVFGKYTDFALSMSSDKAPFLIVPGPFAQSAKEYEPALQFTSKGRDSFQFLLLSLGGKWTGANTKDGTLGIVEENERAQTKSFVESILGGKSFKALKRVTKIDDLMPLLALGNAEYILVPETSLEALKQKYTTSVTVVAKSNVVPMPMLAVRAGYKGEGLKALKAMAPQTLAALGFDGVKEIKKAP